MSEDKTTGDYIALGPDYSAPLYGADPIFASAVVINYSDENRLYALVSTGILDLPSSGERFDTAYVAAASLRPGVEAVVNPSEDGISFDFWIPLHRSVSTAEAIAAVAQSGAIEWARRYTR